MIKNNLIKYIPTRRYELMKKDMKLNINQSTNSLCNNDEHNKQIEQYAVNLNQNFNKFVEHGSDKYLRMYLSNNSVFHALNKEQWASNYLDQLNQNIKSNKMTKYKNVSNHNQCQICQDPSSSFKQYRYCNMCTQSFCKIHIISIIINQNDIERQFCGKCIASFIDYIMSDKLYTNIKGTIVGIIPNKNKNIAPNYPETINLVYVQQQYYCNKLIVLAYLKNYQYDKCILFNNSMQRKYVEFLSETFNQDEIHKIHCKPITDSCDNNNIECIEYKWDQHKMHHIYFENIIHTKYHSLLQRMINDKLMKPFSTSYSPKIVKDCDETYAEYIPPTSQIESNEIIDEYAFGEYICNPSKFDNIESTKEPNIKILLQNTDKLSISTQNEIVKYSETKSITNSSLLRCFIPSGWGYSTNTLKAGTGLFTSNITLCDIFGGCTKIVLNTLTKTIHCLVKMGIPLPHNFESFLMMCYISNRTLRSHHDWFSNEPDSKTKDFFENKMKYTTGALMINICAELEYKKQEQYNKQLRYDLDSTVKYQWKPIKQSLSIQQSIFSATYIYGQTFLRPKHASQSNKPSYVAVFRAKEPTKYKYTRNKYDKYSRKLKNLYITLEHELLINIHIFWDALHGYILNKYPSKIINVFWCESAEYEHKILKPSDITNYINKMVNIWINDIKLVCLHDMKQTMFFWSNMQSNTDHKQCISLKSICFTVIKLRSENPNGFQLKYSFTQSPVYIDWYLHQTIKFLLSYLKQ